MRLLHLSTYDLAGGAAKAAYRIHRCLLAAGHESEMFVRGKSSKDPTVRTRTDLLGRLHFQMLPLWDRVYGRRLRDPTPTQRSFNPVPTWSLRRHIRPHDYDVVLVHFVGQGFVTPREIGRLKSPVVWVLHDMWAFCGAEHYIDDTTRPAQGYAPDNRPVGQGGADLDRRVWKRKRAAGQRLGRPVVVSASQWLSGLAQESQLLGDAQHRVIPYPIDRTIFRPQDQAAGRRLFNLPQDRPLLLFGAVGALNDTRKGFDLLVDAVRRVRSQCDFDIVIFGNKPGDETPDLGAKVHVLGQFADRQSLAMLYGAADAMAVPSRADNLPQTVLESLCCGTPVAAFRVGGMPDMIRHRETGWLAAPFEMDDLAAGLAWCLDERAAGRTPRDAVAESLADMVDGDRIARAYEAAFALLPRR